MPTPPLVRPHADARLLRTRSTPHTEVSEWCIHGQRLFTKVHHDPARLSRELHALTTFARTLGQSPRVLAAFPHHLLLEAAPGSTVSAEDLPPEAWQAAGDWLRRVHSIPHVPPDALPLATALSRRLKGLLRRARTVLSPALVTWCRTQVGPVDALATARVWCHRDFTPDNWLWDTGAGRLWILDFEHSRPDLPWSDLVKLEATAFRVAPEARTPFYEGYGAVPSPEHRRAHVVWHGLATLTWGLRHHEPGFVALGTEILRQEGVSPDLLPESSTRGPDAPNAR